jgi:hypothetical protein
VKHCRPPSRKPETFLEHPEEQQYEPEAEDLTNHLTSKKAKILIERCDNLVTVPELNLILE